MGDLRERLRALDRLEPPDLRSRLGTHVVPPPSDRRRGRVAVGAGALAVALLAVGLVYIAFRGTTRPAAPAMRPALHPNGPIWFLGGEHPGSVFGPSSGVFWVDPDGGQPHAVPTPKELYSITGLAVSPDGERIALSNGGGEFPPRNIYVMRPDGTGLRKITSGDFYEVTPAWSPDGRSIVFASTRCCATAHSSGNYALYTMSADGSGLRRITQDSASDLSPAWSPDGTRIAYVVTPPNVPNPPPKQDWQIWVVNADGTGARALTTDHRYDDAVTWSPDGKKLAYISHLSDDRDWQIRVMRADGSGQHTVFTCTGSCRSGGYTLAWSPDGKEIALTVFLKGTGSTQRIGLINAGGGGFRLLDTQGVDACCLSWIPRSGS
jgi:Tol biopolymer transport system component